MNSDDLSSMLHRAVNDIDLPPGFGQSATAGHRRARGLAARAAAASIVVGAIAAGGFALHSRTSPATLRSSGVSGGPATQQPEGRLMTASGWVIRHQGGPRLCDPRVATTGSPADVARYCPVYVKLTADGTTASLPPADAPRYATVIGRLTGDTLTVTTLTPSTYSPPPPSPFPALPQVDCRAPAGGWAAHVGDLDGTAAARYQDRHPGAVQQLSQESDASRRPVLVVVATDPVKVQQDLAADYPSSLCVIAATHTAAVFEAANTAVGSLFSEEPGNVVSSGTYTGEDNQPRIDVDVARATARDDQVAAAAGGLVVLHPLLQPLQH